MPTVVLKLFAGQGTGRTDRWTDGRAKRRLYGHNVQLYSELTCKNVEPTSIQHNYSSAGFNLEVRF